jgi:hypothetical protein
VPEAPNFDASKKVHISGTVKEYEARNPHSYLHVNAVDENGRTREYVCESHGVTQLSRIGITPQLFKAGTKVRITGSLSRQSPYMCFFESVEFADGRTVSVNGPAGSGGAPQPSSVSQRKDIFGAWLLAPIPNRSTSGPQPMIQLLTLTADETKHLREREKVSESADVFFAICSGCGFIEWRAQDGESKYKGVDVALEKSFFVAEGKSLTFRAEATNALNHVNLGQPGSAVPGQARGDEINL